MSSLSSKNITKTLTRNAALRQEVKRSKNASLHAIIDYGIISGMEQIRKITVHIPVSLLAAAQKETGEGVTETVRKGLELLRRAHAYRQMEKLRGKVKFDFSVDELRDDRR